VNTTSAPTASAQTFCSGSTVANLVATGSTLKWYTALTGGSALATSTTLASNTYYVSQTVNSCEGSRTAVSVTVNPIPSAPTASAQTFCSGSTVANLVGTGSTLKWYTALTGGSALATSTTLASNTYYVSQTVNGCESSRTAVSITVNPITSAPTASAQIVGFGSTVSNLIATGTSLQWYSVSTGGTALASNASISTGTYYVSQTANNCVSVRTSVTVSVGSINGEITQSTPGSYNLVLPSFVKGFKSEVIGAGGGGGRGHSADGNRGAGGGGGAFAGSYLLNTGSTYSITVGEGGLGGTNASNISYGRAGGNSMVQVSGTTLLQANGGNGGVNNVNSGGSATYNSAGGTATANASIINPTLKSGGNGGTTSAANIGNGGGGSASWSSNGNPANAQTGGVALGGLSGAGANGTSGSNGSSGGNFGGGGSGGGRNTNSTDGGNGATGASRFTYVNISNLTLGNNVTVCNNTTATITLNSTSLAAGTYAVTYTVASNTISSAATMTFASGTGDFTTPSLPTAGAQTLTITRITLSSETGIYSEPSNALTGTITVRPAFTSGTISSIGETICYNGDPAVIGSTTVASGGDASITYKWQANGLDIANSNSPTYDPAAGLTATTTYTRFAKDATCNTTFAESSGSYVVTINPTGTWIGASTGNWNDAANWCGGIPAPSASVIVPSGVTVSVDAATTISNLTINSGGTLVIATGKTLIVNGVLTNNGTMRLESNGVTSGQLFQGTTALASGDGTCEYSRVMPEILNDAPGQPGNMNRSYYFGSPVASAYSSGSYQPVSISTGLAGSNNTSLNLFRYNEVSNQFQNLITTGTVASNASFAPGMGYALISSPSINGGTYFGQATITGKYFMNGDITVNVTKTGTNGYNLLSNPYPSNLKWSDVLSTNSTIQGDVSTYWVRTYEDGMGMIFKNFVVNGADGQGVGTGGQTNIIAPGQAFWVKVGASGTFTFTNNMRTTDASNNSYTASVNRIMRFNLVNSSNGIDDIAVYLNENSSLGVDAFDSEKRIPSTSIHQLYTLEGTTKLAINGFNNALAKDTVLLGMQIPTAGTYSINASQIDATIEEDIFLEDKITGAYQNLKTTPNYSFTSVAGTFNNRFVLHFAPNVPALPGQTAATAIAMPTSNWPQCNNVSTEDQWHAFAATSEAVSIAVNTTTTDIVIELQDGTGNVVAQENAVNGIGNETLNFFGLTAGQTYKVGVRNNISSQPTGSYGICVKSLKRGGCDYGAGPYSLCQYYKATWAGSTGVSYTFTFTGTSGPAEGQTFTRTQNSDICVLSTVTPLLPYGSTYDVVISNTYTLTDGAGNTEQISVPSNNGCQVITMAEPQTTLSNSSSCNNGARFRGAVVSSMPWVCGSNNWRWRFTEVNPLTMQEVGLPIELNRGSASNYLNLGTVAQLQNGKTYAVQTAPMFAYTGTNYNWGPTQYLCIVGAANVTQDAAQDAMQDPSEDASQESMQQRSAMSIDNDVLIYSTTGQQIKVWTNTENAELTNATIRVYNSTGSLVYTQRMSSNEMLIDLNTAAGLYIVEVGSVKRKVVISPLVP
jgi:hypothetical protein